MRATTLFNASVLSLTLILGLGCPSPPESAGSGPAGPPAAGGEGPPPGGGQNLGPGGGAPGDAPPPGADGPGGPPPADAAAGGPGGPGGAPGDAPPTDGAGGSAPAGGSAAEGAKPGMPADPGLNQIVVGEPPAPGEGFSQLMREGQAEITITGTVEGKTDVMVEFVVLTTTGDHSSPEVIHTEQVKGGTFSITAPATHGQEIYVSALKDLTGNGPTPDDAEGYAALPIKLDGSDITVAIKFDGRPSWVDDVFKPLEGLQPREQPAPEEPDTLGGGAPN